MYELGEGAALGGRRTLVLTGLLCELTCTSTTVVAVLSLLASLRSVHSIAEKGERSGTSRQARDGLIDKADQLDNDGDAISQRKSLWARTSKWAWRHHGQCRPNVMIGT